MHLGNMNFSDPHTRFCFELFKKCRASIGPNQDVMQSECGRNISRRCFTATRPPGPVFPRIKSNIDLPTILLVVFILIAVFSVFANGFVCVVYSFCKEIRTAKHYFMMNLATADVFIALFAIPFYLTQYIDDASMTLCQIGSMVDVLCCTSSILSFTMISAERFVAVKYPLRYITIVSRRRCLMVLTCLWIYSIAFSIAAWIPIGKLHKRHCVFFSDSYLVVTTIASFLLPLLVMFVAYGWIYKVAKHQAGQINAGIPRGMHCRVKREFKAAKTLTLIIGAFVVCWLPFFCYMWIFVLYEVKVPFRDLHFVVQIVRYLNSLANPFIYVGINRDFRRNALKMLKRVLPYGDRERRVSETNGDCTNTTEFVLRKISGGSIGTPCNSSV